MGSGPIRDHFLWGTRQEYQVDDVVGHRLVSDENRWDLLVKMLGCPESDNRHRDIHDVFREYPQMVVDYVEKLRTSDHNDAHSMFSHLHRLALSLDKESGEKSFYYRRFVSRIAPVG